MANPKTNRPKNKPKKINQKMKNLLKLKFAIAIVLLFNISTNAQKCNLRADEIDDFKNRTLLIIKESLNERSVKDLEEQISSTRKPEKKKELSEELNYYKTRIQAYSVFDTWFSEYWKHNANIKISTWDEIHKIPKDSRKNYLVMRYQDLDFDYFDGVLGKKFPSKNKIPAMYIIKLEEEMGFINSIFSKFSNKVDVFTYVPDFLHRSDRTFHESDFKLTIKIMSNLIKTIEKNNEKNFTTKNLAEYQSESLCSKIPEKEIYFEKDILKQASDMIDFKKETKVIPKVVSIEQLYEKIDNEEDILFGISIPIGIQYGYDRIEYMNCLINPNNGKFYAYSCKGQLEIPGPLFTKSVFKDFYKCIE